MKLLFSFILILSTYASAYSQKAKIDTSRSCLEIANELSYYWKLDSLANNGFRFYTNRMFLNCKLGIIYADILLTKLGHPNEIRRTNKGVEYIYYYFDIRKMPKGYNAPSACWYIAFKFENDKNYLSSIEDGDMDIFE